MSGPGPLVRTAAARDAAAMAAIYAPLVRTTAISFELEPPAPDELERRRAAAAETHAWLVAEIDGALAGYAYATRFRGRPAYDWTCETAVYVAQDARGRGVGRALMEQLLERLTSRGYRTAVAGIALPNAASQALHAALGYVRAGSIERAGWKFGRWHAIEFWECPLGAEGQDPGSRPPRPASGPLPPAPQA